MHESDHRLSLLGQVSAELARAGVPYALIGAAALAVHGVSRSTHDLDLLAVDPACLRPDRWAALQRSGVGVDVRRGDLEDPLAGVVRFSVQGERPVDLVLGKAPWQAAALARARTGHLAGVDLPVLAAPDLVLLKLFAGGPQDAWDIVQLLAAGTAGGIVAEVEDRLDQLPPSCADLWRRIRGA
jgi:hypothetical protein